MTRFKSLFLFSFLILAPTLSSCSTEQIRASGNEREITFIEQWDPETEISGRIAYGKLIASKDSFDKTEYLDLPEDLTQKPSLKMVGEYIFEFSLFKDEISKQFVPLVKVSYLGTDWQFIESVQFKVGDEVNLVNSIQEPLREIMPGGYVFELMLLELSKSDINLLGDATVTTPIEVRVNGKLYEEKVLNSIERKGLEMALDAYRYMFHSNLL